MNKIWKILPLLFLSVLFIGCENKSEGSAASNVTNNGDDASDLVENETWNKTIDIVWNGTDVTVTGSADGVKVSHSNGYVTINSNAENVEYIVSGVGTGQLSIYGNYKYKLLLDGLTLACPDGPAINSQCPRTCYAVLQGTNILSDGSSYAESEEDRKAAFFSEGRICFSGSGSLEVTGNCKHAIASDYYIRFCSGTGTLNLTAKASDGIHTNYGVIINDGTLTINAADDGIQCEASSVVITGGTLNITSTSDKGILSYSNINISGGIINISSKYKCMKTDSHLTISGGTITAVASATSSSDGTPEGIEAKGQITISGGQVFVKANDDAINAGGDITISGGSVCAYSTGNDGIDANGNCYIKGGLVYAIGASSPEVAIDANTEKGYQLYVQGGTLVAIGGLENGATLSQSCYSASSWSKNTWYALTVGSTTFAFITPSSGGTGMVVSGASTPALMSGVTATGTSIFNGMGYYPATISGGSSVSLSAYNGGNMGGGGIPSGNNPGGGHNPGGGPK
ncbi:MAG: carbohydrate-binding domain-containing protein [Paludibacteraceae bacterium]|nr:carbohydrate-binding domain-containing protein [Paludibacteraceae bacterium]